MEKMIIKGGFPLSGSIKISGAKNAALPIMCASLLTSEKLHLSQIPDLSDIRTLKDLLRQHGVTITNDQKDSTSLILHANQIATAKAPYDLVKKMRASILVLGPLLARHGEARVSLPGGCAIGARPVDIHLEGLKALGAQINMEDGYIVAKAPNGLKGTKFRFPFVSVGASENMIMAACLASGETILDNVAREPEITDLCDCLTKMGAKIDGIGTSQLIIQGQTSLKGAHHAIIPDRIEAGSYIIATAITRGQTHLKNINADLLQSPLEILKECGVNIVIGDNHIDISCPDTLTPINVTSQPFPGFPTDLQAQMMALMTTISGTSTIVETIFENRFMHVAELKRMGANITLEHRKATIHGGKPLIGAPVMATDLRASMALIIAGLACDGTTTVDRLYHLDRGFEKLDEKLKQCGANITRQ